jgi:hypothetical protein
VEQEVQEDDLFMGWLVFLGWCWPSKKVALVLNVVLGINKYWLQECRRRVSMGDKACEEQSYLLVSFLDILNQLVEVEKHTINHTFQDAW